MMSTYQFRSGEDLLSDTGSCSDNMFEGLGTILDCGRGDLGERERSGFVVIPALGSSGRGLSLGECCLLLSQKLGLLSLDSSAFVQASAILFWMLGDEITRTSRYLCPPTRGCRAHGHRLQ